MASPAGPKTRSSRRGRGPSARTMEASTGPLRSYCVSGGGLRDCEAVTIPLLNSGLDFAFLPLVTEASVPSRDHKEGTMGLRDAKVEPAVPVSDMTQARE